MNSCPPKPGFTDMINNRSIWGNTSHTADNGVAGFNATPALQPSSRMRASWRCRCGAASAWTVSPVAPACAKVSRYFSGRQTMRWTSSGSVVRDRTASITFEPNVRLGTNWPSMTSMCSQSAPPASHMATSSPSFVKSALRIDGAIRTFMEEVPPILSASLLIRR